MGTSNNSAKLSIGAVAEATGIPASTLRTWERRYDYPSPERTEGGHRLYEPSVVERLELIAEALDRGHRAGQVVGDSADELRALLEDEATDTSADETTETTERAGRPPEPEVDELPTPPPRSGESRFEEYDEWLPDWIRATLELELNTLNWSFQEAWNRLGAIGFLKERLSPYLREIGVGWAEGRYDIVHEHHASEVFRDFLSSKWRPLVERVSGPRCLVAAPPGERHALALHMVAVTMATAGWEVGMLGADVPVEELVRVVEEQETDVLAVTVASSYGEERARRVLTDLVEQLPEEIGLVVGGEGAPSGFEGAFVCSDLEELYEWARGQN